MFKIHGDSETPQDVLLKDGVLRTAVLNDEYLSIERGIELENHKMKTQYLSKLFGIKSEAISSRQYSLLHQRALPPPLHHLPYGQTLKNQIRKCATLQYTISLFLDFRSTIIQKINNSPD